MKDEIDNHQRPLFGRVDEDVSGCVAATFGGCRCEAEQLIVESDEWAGCLPCECRQY
jgi:hypothetical protein